MHDACMRGLFKVGMTCASDGCTRLYAYIFICMHTSQLCMHTQMNLYVCINVCMDVCMYVYMSDSRPSIICTPSSMSDTHMHATSNTHT